MLQKHYDKFNELFATKVDHTFFAPGRINLIGEHIDYSGGYVFPCAITFGTYAWVSMRDDQELHLYSENFSELGIIKTSLSDLSYKKEDDWANYPKGCLAMLEKRGITIPRGLNIYYYGNIPNGAGLSSSASIEMVTLWLVNTLFDLKLSMIDCALIGRETENNYLGVNSGIMDQFAIGMGQKDHAIYLNTDTLDYTMVPIELGDHKIVISNTNKRRGLADSKYNERRAECEEALAQLQTQLPIKNLCDLSMNEFNEHQSLITNEINLKRARHAVSENERTKQATKVLQSNDLVSFGKLMNESHVSMRDDYEATGIELDTLVEAAWAHPGTLGARVTGAGFGGCSIAIVKAELVDDYIEKVSSAYRDKIGYDATFYVAAVGEGTHQID